MSIEWDDYQPYDPGVAGPSHVAENRGPPGIQPVRGDEG